MLLEARGSLDQAKRKAIYDDMQVMVSEEAGTVDPGLSSPTSTRSPRSVQGLEAEPARRPDGLRLRGICLARGLIAAGRGRTAGPRHRLRKWYGRRNRMERVMNVRFSPRARPAGDRARHAADRSLRGLLRHRDAAGRRRARSCSARRRPPEAVAGLRDGHASRRSGDPALPALACRPAATAISAPPMPTTCRSPS